MSAGLVAFEDRADAGRRLSQPLASLRGQDLVVLGLPRGGVPVAAQVATALDAPLDVVLVRKLGLPSRPELAMGAIGEDDALVLDARLLAVQGITPEQLSLVQDREREVLAGMAARLRRGRPRALVRGRTVVVVDDGLATGSTAEVACRVVRGWGAARVVLAAPVGPPATCRRLEACADAVVCLWTPRRFSAVGAYYRDFRPTPETEVVALLNAAARHGC